MRIEIISRCSSTCSISKNFKVLQELRLQLWLRISQRFLLFAQYSTFLWKFWMSPITCYSCVNIPPWCVNLLLIWSNACARWEFRLISHWLHEWLECLARMLNTVIINLNTSILHTGMVFEESKVKHLGSLRTLTGLIASWLNAFVSSFHVQF